jgi:uncharacterized protein YbaA (DUF1428 family)
MENKIESARGIEKETENYLQLFLYQAPKKNHDALAKNLMQFGPWFKKNGVRIEYYHLGKSETQGAIDSAKESGMDIMEGIGKTLSTAAEDEEEIWIEQQYFRDHKHCEDIYAKMMQDKSIEPLGNEFFGLVTQGKKLITGGFIRLRA